MPDEHARLSPSSSERWITCPASVRLAEQYPRQESVWADEGTTAHSLGELKASIAFGKLTGREAVARSKTISRKIADKGYDADEMDRHTTAYSELLQELAAGYENAHVLLEQRVQTGVPLCWGTSDAVIVGTSDLHVVDFKYGSGVRVDVKENPQLMLYGVGALETIGDSLGVIDRVHLTIHQPRMDSVSSWSIEADELRAWRDSLLPIAHEALGEDARFGPSEDACRFCPAAGDCRARMEHATRHDFAQSPDLLSRSELALLLEDIPGIQRWCTSVQSRAMALAMEKPGEVPGWKVVQGNGRRQIVDQEIAIQTAIDAGWPADKVSVIKAKGVTELEGMMGKDAFAQVFGPFIEKKPGSPALVPESDPRAPIDPGAAASAEFGALPAE